MTPNFDTKKKSATGTNSVFFDIAPQSAGVRNESSPAAAPAAAPEQLAALKTQLDKLEKNISTLLERKTDAPAVLPGQAALLGDRLDAMERNITALVERKLLERDTALKADAATREEEERRKSIELDRRVHAQLEKSWLRAEELEKKLEETYKISIEAQLKRKEDRKEEAQALAEFGKKAAALEERFSELRSFIGSSRSRDEDFFEESGGRFLRRADVLEEKLTGLGNAMELLRHKGEETAKQVSGVGAKVDATGEILGRIDPERFEVHLSELHGELIEIRQAFKGQADHFWEKFLDFNQIADNFMVKSKALELGFEKAVSGNERLLAAAVGNISAGIDKALARFMTSLQEKNREQFAQLSASYDSALDTLRQVGSVCSSIEYVSKRLDGYKHILETFVAQVGDKGLSSMAGVSGIVVRENFGAIKAMAADLKREKEYLEAARKEILDKTNRVIKGGQG